MQECVIVFLDDVFLTSLHGFMLFRFQVRVLERGDRSREIFIKRDVHRLLLHSLPNRDTNFMVLARFSHSKPNGKIYKNLSSTNSCDILGHNIK